MNKTPKPLPEYDGPRLKEVQTYNLAKVQMELKRLNEDPQPSHNPTDEQELIELWRSDPIDNPQDSWSAEDISELRRKAQTYDLRCWQNQVFTVYLDRWAHSLSDTECWSLVEACRGEKVTISERRYTSRSQLRDEVCSIVYHMGVTSETK